MTPPGDNADKNLGEIVQEVSEKASLLVREEIELAKAEITAKAKTLAKGAGVGAAAGFFGFFALIMFLQTLAFFFADLFDSAVWIGYGLVTIILLVLGVIAGLLAKRWLSTGAPTPDLAIEEAKITRQTFEQQGVERDQLARGLERSDKQEETA